MYGIFMFSFLIIACYCLLFLLYALQSVYCFQGEILGFGLSGALIAFDTTIFDHSIKGWEVVFYVFGLIGMLWFPFFYWRVYDNPDVHPHCFTEEVAIIKEG